MSQEFPFEQHWAVYRRDRRRRIVWIVGGLLLQTVIGGVLSKTLETTSGRLVLFIFQIIWVAGLVYLTARINTVKCPHCGEHFAFYEIGILFVKSPPRAAQCQNCKIPRYLGSSFYEGILKLSAFGKR